MLWTKEIFGDLLGDIHVPPGKITNAMIMLHGLGDSYLPFFSLGKSMNLPETIVMSVQGPMKVPELESDLSGPGHWMWSDELRLDAAQDISDDWGFKCASQLLHILVNRLISNGIAARNIIFFGYGQGGMLSLYLGAQLDAHVISIGGILPSDTMNKESSGDCLICGGDTATKINSIELSRIKSIFSSVKRLQWKNHVGDVLPSTAKRNAWYPILQFLSKVLVQRGGIPDGAVQIN